MRSITDFFNWMAPSVPFDFIKNHAADECASLLASKDGTRSGFFPQKLRIQVNFETEQNYYFSVKAPSGGFFKLEALGTIEAIADNYSQIEGSARARPTVLTYIMSVYGLAVIGFVAFGLIYSLVTSNAPTSSSLPVGIGIVLFVMLNVFVLVWSQKWLITMYTDMVLGLVLRSV